MCVGQQLARYPALSGDKPGIVCRGMEFILGALVVDGMGGGCGVGFVVRRWVDFLQCAGASPQNVCKTYPPRSEESWGLGNRMLPWTKSWRCIASCDVASLEEGRTRQMCFVLCIIIYTTDAAENAAK